MTHKTAEVPLRISVMPFCSPKKNYLDRSERDSKGGFSFNSLPVKRNSLAKPRLIKFGPDKRFSPKEEHLFL